MIKYGYLAAILFAIGVSFTAGMAQTTEPSRTAYNYGRAKSYKAKAWRKNKPARRHSVRVKSNARKQVQEIPEAKISFESNTFDLACNPGDSFTFDLSVLKADGTQLIAKLSKDYSQSQFVTAVIDETTKELNIQCGFPSGPKYFGIESADFPGLYKVLSVTVKKVDVSALVTTTPEMTLDNSSSVGQLKITGQDVNGSDLPLVRLKATSDNPNVLLSFPDSNNPMTLTVTSTPGSSGISGNVIIEAVDGTKDFQPLKLVVNVTALPSQSATNNGPAAAPTTQPNPTPAATPTVAPAQTSTATPLPSPAATAKPVQTASPKPAPTAPKSSATPAKKAADSVNSIG